jgi:hypothetical protein
MSDLEDFIVSDEHVDYDDGHTSDSDDSFGSIDYPDNPDNEDDDGDDGESQVLWRLHDLTASPTHTSDSSYTSNSSDSVSFAAEPVTVVATVVAETPALPLPTPLPVFDGDDAGLPPAFMCPITRLVMREPVITREGMTYEREAIENWLAIHKIDPQTRRHLTRHHLTLNRALKNVIKFVLWPPTPSTPPTPPQSPPATETMAPEGGGSKPSKVQKRKRAAKKSSPTRK